MVMAARCISKSEFSSMDQENDSRNAVFMILKRSPFYPILKHFGFLGYKPKFPPNWIIAGTQAGLQPCRKPRYLPIQSRRPQRITKVQNGDFVSSPNKYGFFRNDIRSIFEGLFRIALQLDKYVFPLRFSFPHRLNLRLYLGTIALAYGHCR
jgi:hypothetical protein